MEGLRIEVGLTHVVGDLCVWYTMSIGLMRECKVDIVSASDCNRVFISSCVNVMSFDVCVVLCCCVSLALDMSNVSEY